MFLCLSILTFAVAAAGFLPSLKHYTQGDTLAVRVNSMTSSKGVLPYPHYSIKTCRPDDKRLRDEALKENLGEILWGDKIEPSMYFVEVGTNISCRKACETLLYAPKEMEELTKRIENEYRGNMMLDNLPVAVETRGGPHIPKLVTGYPLGVPKKHSLDKKTRYINNHLQFKIYYNDADAHEVEDITIVGFYVSAHSIVYDDVDKQCTPTSHGVTSRVEPLTTARNSVTYTYSVSWIESPELRWATRWDVYIRGAENDTKIHWLSLVNSSLVLVFLAGMVAMIMMRTLRRDFHKYNDERRPEDQQEESGWKLVHGDVFRTPDHPVILTALVASGTQIIAMIFTTLTFSAFGFLQPANRGLLLTAVILSYVVLGFLAGYNAARLYKVFKVQSWKNAFFTGLFVPGCAMIMYLLLNTIHWAKHASSAVPFPTLLILFVLWFCCSLPLVIVGSQIGFKTSTIEFPCKVNSVPRLIPAQSIYLDRHTLILCGGVLPFGAAFIELLYILSSFWQGRIYYVFGFLALAMTVVIITCVELSVVLVYFQLCYEDYRWWWRSFLLTASGGLYLFLYSVYYLTAVLSIRQPSSILLYLGYMLTVSALFSICTGSVGFYSAFYFVRKIYGAIKID